MIGQPQIPWLGAQLATYFLVNLLICIPGYIGKGIAISASVPKLNKKKTFFANPILVRKTAVYS
jgi:hypothetical protein